jgi:hypothetical protein
MSASTRRRSRLSLYALGVAAATLLVSAAAFAQKPGPIPPTRGGERPVTRIRVLKTWNDTIKLDEFREIARRMEITYDYDRGVATLSAYGADGVLMSQQELSHGPRPSQEEIDEAVAILQRDPQIGSIMRSRSAVIEGGFILEERTGDPCGPRTRCLQIQLLSPDRTGLIRWSVVDLTRRSIVYAAYVPNTNGAKK